MARSGRFGNLPGKAPDLTNTIVALLEQYESARDRNILSAWMNGGKFEGKKVTDGRIRNWFKMRRSQYGKDDPEYDYWDQQLDQIDYQIGESKMLLRFEQGNINEGAAARWYTSNANRFPKNSEAWREAMRNAARFKKAAREQARAARTVSDSEKFQNAKDRIYAQKVKPAEQAMDILNRALLNSGFLNTPDGTFMSLDVNAMASTQIFNAFMDSRQGRKFARQFKRATGREFSWREFRGVIRTARQGHRQVAQEAKKYGFQSYVSDELRQAKGWGTVLTQTNTFTSDIHEIYRGIAIDFYEGVDVDGDGVRDGVPTTAQGRTESRAEYRKRLQGLIKKANKVGDDWLVGVLRNEIRALDGKDPVSNARGLIEGGGSTGNGVADLTPNFDGQNQQEAGAFINPGGLTGLEGVAQQANLDEEILAGLEAGTHVSLLIDGDIYEVTVEAAQARTGRSEGTWMERGFAQNYITDEFGNRRLVLIEVKPLVVAGTDGQTSEWPGVYTYTDSNGRDVFVYGDRVSFDPPWGDLFEVDYSPETDRNPTGTVWNEESNTADPVVTKRSDGVYEVHPVAYSAAVSTAEAAGTDTSGISVPELITGFVPEVDEFGNAIIPAPAAARAGTVTTIIDPETGETTTATPEEAQEVTTTEVRTDEELLASLSDSDRFIVEALGLDPRTLTDEALNVYASWMRNQGLDQNTWDAADPETQDAWRQAVTDGTSDIISQLPEGDETNVFGDPLYEEGDVPLAVGEPVTAEVAGEVEVETRVVEEPWVFTDTGTTGDRSGLTLQYLSDTGRVTFAAMSPEEQRAFAAEVAVANGIDPNDAAAMLPIYSMLDSISASGAAGEDEYDFIYNSGALAGDERLDRAQTLRRIHDVKSNPASSLVEDNIGVAEVRAMMDAGWTEEEIRAESPYLSEVMDEVERIEADSREALPAAAAATLDDGSPAPEGFDPYAAIDGGTSAPDLPDSEVVTSAIGGDGPSGGPGRDLMAAINVAKAASRAAAFGSGIGTGQASPGAVPRGLDTQAGIRTTPARPFQYQKVGNFAGPSIVPIKPKPSPVQPTPPQNFATPRSLGQAYLPPGFNYNPLAGLTRPTPTPIAPRPPSTFAGPSAFTVPRPPTPPPASNSWGPTGYEEPGDYSWE